MRWIQLSMDRVDAMTRQADEACATLAWLAAGRGPPGTDARHLLRRLLASCRRRLAALSCLYAANDLHPQAPALERQRMRLQAAVHAAEATVAADEDLLPRPQPRPRVAAAAAAAAPTFERFPAAAGEEETKGAYLAKGGGALAWDKTSARPGHTEARLEGTAGLASEGAWRDPALFSYRPADDRRRWVGKAPFDSVTRHTHHLAAHAAPSAVTGPAAGPYLCARAEVVLLRPAQPLKPVDSGKAFTSIVPTRRRCSGGKVGW